MCRRAKLAKKNQRGKKKFLLDDFGQCNVDKTIFEKIACCRSKLYENWFGLKDSTDEYIPIAVQQAAEYATIAYYITARFKNCLVLGADNAIFGHFYSFCKKTPTLYFKRFYY